ncbi:hypothetical protein BDA99DRAFT_525794 [Phascolomyces articulosus]|uniref:Early meiotic induction protein 1 n=1 Tax=Phascolomyces articulosus TaxID=60185 RepID=A0AAD5JYD6_9FUNG|nr:hypothetical protein BDA99DRAFT_525794 [Phascolomyces articulosus]
MVRHTLPPTTPAKFFLLFISFIIIIITNKMTTEEKTNKKSGTEYHDEDTSAFFNEFERETKKDYAKCSMSQTFDNVFQCYTLGAQAIHYYRYGEKKDCSSYWEDFKFCLKTKTKSNEEGDRMLKNRELEKEARKKQLRSSEEVWEARDLKQQQA